MTTLRIYDCRNNVLALDLSDLIDLLAPQSLEASWTVSPVRLHHPSHGLVYDEFMIVGQDLTGQRPDPLDVMAANGSSVNGVAFSEAAHAARQVIWGQFVAVHPAQADTWMMIRAVDSTFYEVTTSDEAVLARIRSAYKDVRVATGPIVSAPISSVPREGQLFR